MSNKLLSKLGVASVTSVTLSEALSLDTLWSALISLGVSVLSVLAVEGVTLLKNYLIKKSKELDEKSKGGN